MTIKEIAKLAGVSISTVSKIINNKADNINIETQKRVLKIVKEYNYTPYSFVNKKENTKSFLIGVLLKHMSQKNLLQGIVTASQKLGYNILICNSDDDEATELKQITALCKHNIDGIIWEPVSPESLQHEKFFKQKGIHISYINSYFTNKSYCIDFAQMGYTVTQALIQYHHTNIACLIKKESFRSQMVLEGFKKCLFDHKIPYNDDMVLYSNDNYICTKLTLQKYTGIISSHFASALSLYETMNHHHYSIPFDLSLVSLREDGREAICFPRISSLQIPYEQFGLKICENLIGRCESPKKLSFPHLFKDTLPLDHKESLYIPPSYRSKKIIVIGSINTDTTLAVDDFPLSGSTTLISSSTIAPGGKGTNQAIGAAKLGREVTLIGKIGDDFDSSIILDTLKKEQVNTHGINRVHNTPTGKAYINVQKDAESAITILPGANAFLAPDDILSKEHLFSDTGFCLISTEIPKGAFIEAAKIAHKHKIKTIIKPATLKELPKELIKNTDIFIPNRKEAENFCPNKSIEEQASYFFSLGIPIVIITLGHKGCYLKTQQTQNYFPASNFTSTDSTGGADAFISALASYLIEGFSLECSIQIATYAAGFCISRTGVVSSLVDRTTLENHIKIVQPGLLTKH